MDAATSPARTVDLGLLSHQPWATFIWGESRSVLNRVLFAMTWASDPSPFWLTIRGPGDTPSDPCPAELGWISEDRLYVTGHPEDLRPQDAVGNMAFATMIRSDEPSSTLLSDLLRLPPVAQEIIGRTQSGERPHAIGIANTDRVRSFYPTSPSGVRPFLDAFLAQPLLPFFSARSPPGEGRFAFDFVFEVRAKDLSRWREGTLLCEKAPPETSIPAGSRFPLSEIPAAVRALEGLPPP